MLLVVDALADHGASDGVDGAASSLDLTVRAASAVAEHHVRSGDRVGLRVVGRRPASWSATAPGPAPAADASTPWPGSGRRGRRGRGGRPAAAASPAAPSSSCSRRCWPSRSARSPRRCSGAGVPVLVVDTLPADVRPRRRGGRRPAAGRAGLADAPPRADRLLQRLAALGLPGRGVARPGHPRRRAAPAGPAGRAAPGGGPVNGVLAAVADCPAASWCCASLVFLGPVVAVLAAGPAGRWPTWWVAVGIVVLAGGVRRAARVRGRRRGHARGRWPGGPARSTTGCTRRCLVAATALLVAHLAALRGRLRSRRDAARPGAGAAVGAPRRGAAARRTRSCGGWRSPSTGSPSSPGSGWSACGAGLVATVAAAVALTAGPPAEDAS